MIKRFKNLKKWEKAVVLIFFVFVIIFLSTIFIDFSRHRNFYQPFFYEAKKENEKDMLDIEVIKIEQKYGRMPMGEEDVVKSVFYILDIPIDVVER
ncbi:MAG: hypothetical protein PUF48_03585 [Oscillospiraceae bacterium]|nr:hypothetical protein [Oscillospiraceae bacterium]